MYGLTSVLLGALPLTALAAGLAVIGWGVRDTATLGAAMLPALVWRAVATLAAVLSYAALTVVGVRVLALGLREGYHPVRSRSGWQLWATERLMDAARNYLFPVYASLLTPWWLRLLGREGRQGHRDLDSAADPEVHRYRGRRVPRRRHHGRVLRTRRRLDPRRPRDDRQAGVPGQLRHHPARSAGARRRVGRGALARHRTRPRQARRGWAARRSGCAGSRRPPTYCARSIRRRG